MDLKLHFEDNRSGSAELPPAAQVSSIPMEGVTEEGSYNSITMKNIQLKNGRPKQTFFQRRYTDGQQAHEKMFIIINYQRTANQNYNEVPPHTGQNGHDLKSLQINASKNVEKMLLHCWWECKLVQPLWKTLQRFLQKLKIELPCDPAIPPLGIYPDKTIIQKDMCAPTFI